MAFTALAIASAIAAAASAGAGVYASNKQAEAASRQNQLQEAMFGRQMQLSQAQQDAALAPVTDARGNRREYIPGVGWRETLSPQSAAIQAASDAEERNRLSVDLPRERLQRERNFQRRLGEWSLADAILATRDLGSRTPQETEAALVRAGVARATSGERQARGALGLQSFRQGTGGETAAAELGRSQLEDTRSALEGAALGAPDMYAQTRDALVNGVLNRYNMLAQRASQNDELPFQPSNLADAMSLGTSKQQAVVPQALGAAMNIRAPTILPVDDMLPARMFSGAQTLNYLSNQRKLWDALMSRQQAATDYRTPTVAANAPSFDENGGLW